MEAAALLLLLMLILGAVGFGAYYYLELQKAYDGLVGDYTALLADRDRAREGHETSYAAYTQLKAAYEPLKARVQARVPNPQFFSISHGTYPGNVYVGLALPIDTFIANLQHHLGSLTQAEIGELNKPHVGGFAWRFRGIAVLWVAPTNDPVYFYGALAHEIFHTVEFLFKHVGIRYRAFSEPFAYQITHLTQQIYAHILKQQ